jgi:lipopolysaccharide transport system ATP-binding protein
MNSEQQHSHSDGEVLVRVEGVSKKFCRSLKKSLWYGLCDIGGELNPFRRQVAEVAGSGLLVAGNGTDRETSELATSDSPLVTPHGLRPDEFYAVRDVSFELRRGEPGGEVAARRIGEANPKGETSWQRANQCLGLIGHNGAGIQAAMGAARTTAEGSPKGAMSGSEQVNTTLLKMLNGLIKPDSGKITMRGRVGALIALGAGFNPILTGETVSSQICGACADLGRWVVS